MPVLALELGTLFPNSAQAEFVGFGLRRLERNGFLGAKAPLRPGFAKKNCVSLCKGKKLQNSAKQNSWIVCRFSLWNVFPLMEPAVWGFGLRLLVRYGLLDAKAGFGGFGLRRLVSNGFSDAKAANKSGNLIAEFSAS